MRVRLPYWFHYKAWTLRSDGTRRRGVWAFIRNHEGRYP